MYVRRSVVDLRQPRVEVPPNRVLGSWNLLRDPSFLQTILGARPILWNWLQNVAEKGDTGDTEADVAEREWGGGCGQGVPQNLEGIIESEITGEHPVQDTSKGPDIYLVGLWCRCVMHFGRHVTLCASGGFQVGGNLREWDAL